MRRASGVQFDFWPTGADTFISAATRRRADSAALRHSSNSCKASGDAGLRSSRTHATARSMSATYIKSSTDSLGLLISRSFCP